MSSGQWWTLLQIGLLLVSILTALWFTRDDW